MEPEKTVTIRVFEFERDWLRATFGSPTQAAVRTLRKQLGCRHLENQRDYFNCTVKTDEGETLGVGFKCGDCNATIILPAAKYEVVCHG